jgi:hypothetical protein
MTMKQQSDAEARAREVYERLIKAGHAPSAIARSLNLFYRNLDEDEEAPTLEQFLACYEREAANSIGTGYLLN